MGELNELKTNNHRQILRIPFTFSTKNDSQNMPRFDKHLEEFYSICDQIELNLVTAKRCLQQIAQAQTHLPVPVVPIAQDNAMTYLQFRELVITQLTYAKDIHDTLQMAAQNI